MKVRYLIDRYENEINAANDCNSLHKLLDKIFMHATNGSFAGTRNYEYFCASFVAMTICKAINQSLSLNIVNTPFSPKQYFSIGVKLNNESEYSILWVDKLSANYDIINLSNKQDVLSLLKTCINYRVDELALNDEEDRTLIKSIPDMLNELVTEVKNEYIQTT